MFENNYRKVRALYVINGDIKREDIVRLKKELKDGKLYARK